MNSFSIPNYPDLTEDLLDMILFIFNRELKPPFVRGEADQWGNYLYFNKANELVGELRRSTQYAGAFSTFCFKNKEHYYNIVAKTHLIAEFPKDSVQWSTYFRLIFILYMSNRLGIKLYSVNWEFD